MTDVTDAAQGSAGVGDFESQRPRLLGLAYRLTGSRADAEDVVQECWLRWQGADRARVVRPEAWLTTVTTRLAVDRLRSAARRREHYPGPWLPEPVQLLGGPEEVAETAESLTLGFLVLLDRLGPLERAVFLLADVFDVPYSQIAGVVGRSEVACRQIASRARRRVRRPGGGVPGSSPEQRRILSGLVGAVAAGDIGAVMVCLAPDVVFISDGGPARRAARRPVKGSDRVARLLVNLARRTPDLDLREATVNGRPALLLIESGGTEQVLTAVVEGGVVTTILVVRNPEKLRLLEQPVALI